VWIAPQQTSPTRAPPADFCNTTRPADTFRGFRSFRPSHVRRPVGGPSGEHPKILASRISPPGSHLSSLAPNDHIRTPVVIQPCCVRLGKPTHTNDQTEALLLNALREKEHLPTGPGAFDPQQLRVILLHLEASFRAAVSSCASTGPRFGLLPTLPAATPFVPSFGDHLDGQPLPPELDRPGWQKLAVPTAPRPAAAP
jgi:hypothetical protein